MTTRLKSLLIGSGALLLVPFIGSQFSQEINWYGFDYMVGAILLVGTSFVFICPCQSQKQWQSRWAWGIAVVLALALAWAEIAVGTFGSPLAGS